MQPYEYAVWVLIFLPVLMGALALVLRLLTKNKQLLLTIVGLNSIIMAVLSIYLLFVMLDKDVHYGGYLTIEASKYVHEGILIADLLLLVVFGALGVKTKSPIIIGLAVVQLGPLAYLEFSNPEPFEAFAFALDYLALVFVLICSIIGSIIAIYAVQYMDDEHKQGRFFFFVLAFLGVMNGAILSNNMIFLYFFWECTTICCYFLIAHEGNKVSLANAKWAAEVTMAGGAALLLGALMLMTFTRTQSLSIMEIIAKNNLAGEAVIALPLFLCAFAAFTKAAQVPFQSWLLGAMVAPTPVSALLHSSTMVKLGVYLVIRFSPALHQFKWLYITVAIVGAFSFAVTALLAIQEKRMKRLLALSTIGNLGLIIMLAAIGTPETIAAAVILTIFHAISKALLFLSAGTVQKIFHRKDIEGSEALFRKAPLMFGAFFIGILTMFLAPFGVFLAKYVALSTTASNPLLVLLIVLGTVGCDVFYIRWLGRTMAYTSEVVKVHLSPLYTYPMWLLAGLAVVLSILLPAFMSNLTDRITGGSALDYTPAYFSIHNVGLIPTFLIFVAFIFIVAYAYLQTKGRQGTPYVGGMYDYKPTLSCPYFETYVPKDKFMRVAEILGLISMVVALAMAVAIPLKEVLGW